MSDSNLNIVASSSTNWGHKWWYVGSFTAQVLVELAKHRAILRSWNDADTHRESDDSRRAMLDSNVVASLVTNLVDNAGVSVDQRLRHWRS